MRATAYFCVLHWVLGTLCLYVCLCLSLEMPNSHTNPEYGFRNALKDEKLRSGEIRQCARGSRSSVAEWDSNLVLSEFQGVFYCTLAVPSTEKHVASRVRLGYQGSTTLLHSLSSFVHSLIHSCVQQMYIECHCVSDKKEHTQLTKQWSRAGGIRSKRRGVEVQVHSTSTGQVHRSRAG